MPNDAAHPAKTRGAVLPLVTSTLGLGQAVLFMMLPVLVEHTGIDLLRLSVAMAVGTGLFLVGAPFWGRRSDRIGRRRAMAQVAGGQLAANAALAAAVTATAAGLLSVQLGFLAVLASRVAYGLTASGILPVAQAWVADASDRGDRLRQFGRLSAGTNVGRVVGPVLASLFVALGAMGPLWLLVLSSAIAVAALAFLKGTDRAPETPPTVEEAPPFRRLLPFVVCAHLMHTAFGLMQYTAGVLIQRRLGLSAEEASAALGVMLTLAAVAMIAVQLLLLPRLRRRVRTALAAGAAGLAVTGFGFAAADGMAAFTACVVLFGVSSALMVPANGTLCSMAVAPDQQGVAAGRLTAANTLGYSTGAVLAGLAGTVALDLPFLVAGALAALLLLGSRLLPVPRNPENPPKSM